MKARRLDVAHHANASQLDRRNSKRSSSFKCKLRIQSTHSCPTSEWASHQTRQSPSRRGCLSIIVLTNELLVRVCVCAKLYFLKAHRSVLAAKSCTPDGVAAFVAVARSNVYRYCSRSDYLVRSRLRICVAYFSNTLFVLPSARA